MSDIQVPHVIVNLTDKRDLEIADRATYDIGHRDSIISCLLNAFGCNKIL